MGRERSSSEEAARAGEEKPEVEAREAIAADLVDQLAEQLGEGEDFKNHMLPGVKELLGSYYRKARETEIPDKERKDEEGAPEGMSAEEIREVVDRREGIIIEEIRAVPSADGKGYYLVPDENAYRINLADFFDGIDSIFGEEKAHRILPRHDVTGYPYSETDCSKVSSVDNIRISRRGKMKLNERGLEDKREQELLKKGPEPISAEKLLETDQEKWIRIKGNLVAVPSEDGNFYYLIPRPDATSYAIAGGKWCYPQMKDMDSISDYEIVRPAYFYKRNFSIKDGSMDGATERLIVRGEARKKGS